MKLSLKDYFSQFGIELNRVANRFVLISMMINGFLQKYGFDTKATINARALKRAIVDYFIDIVRIKKIHNIKYRPISQQSLELMIEAFLAGYDFTTIGISYSSPK